MSKKRVRTLLRVSSKQQLHDDDIPIQRAEVKAYIEKHSDWVFDKEYLEGAISAYKNGVDDRDILQKILEDAKNKEFDILLSYMSDRIGRQEEYAFYVATLNRLGIEVWTINDGQLKTEEHIDKLITYIKFWQNEGESKKTSARVRDTQKELIKSGKFLGGKAPFGYELVPSGLISNHGRLLKKLVIVEEKAEIVRKIYHYAVQYGMGYDRIAKRLNEDGIPPLEADKWKSGTIASILKNPIYMGYPCINRRINHGSFSKLDRKDWIYADEQQKELVIISPQLWERAQEIREARKAKIGASKENNNKIYEDTYNVPFSTRGRLSMSGLCYCGYCGKKLKNGSYANHWTTKSGEKKVTFAGRYVCPSKCSERTSYSMNYLEGVVFNVVERYMERLQNIDISEEIEKMYKEQSRSIQKEIATLQKAKKKLLQDIETLEENIPEAMRGEYYFSVEKLAGLIEEKRNKITETEEAIAKKESILNESMIQQEDMQKFVDKAPNWKEEFKNADVPTKQMLLSTIIDRIIVKTDDINIKFKIRLDSDFLHETPSNGVPKPWLQLYHHKLHRL